MKKEEISSGEIRVDIKKIEKDTEKIYHLEKSIYRIEKKILEIQDLLERELELQQERNIIFKYGLEGIKEHFKGQLSKHKIDASHKLFEVYRNDTRLRYPHEKILKVLISKYDGHVFGFINFNSLVKEAKIGKNKASEYLATLEDLGYILIRRVGKKHLYKINVRILEKELKNSITKNNQEIEALTLDTEQTLQ